MTETHRAETQSASPSGASPRLPELTTAGVRPTQIRLLVPAGCPGENVWVPPNEVKRWENIGYTRGNVPADKLELSWLDIPAKLNGVYSYVIELIINSAVTPAKTVDINWGDGITETHDWGNGRHTHTYAERKEYNVKVIFIKDAEAISAELKLSLAGCSIWQPPSNPDSGGGGSGGGGIGPAVLKPLIPGVGLVGNNYDGQTQETWTVARWLGGTSHGGVPAADPTVAAFLKSDGSWAMPAGMGTRWFNGDGVPVTVPEAKAGDYYLDGVSGIFYLLEA